MKRVSLKRILIALVVVFGSGALAYAVWQPGSSATLPERNTHGAWMTHAWWADDHWFAGSSRKPEDYRGEEAVKKLAFRMHQLGVTDWYIHACPANVKGNLPTDILPQQGRLLKAANPDGQVLAWVGGVLEDCRLTDKSWRQNFANDCAELVREAKLDGVQVNIEPCPSFEPGYLELLEDLRKTLPEGSRISIAGYPPPHWLHPFPQVHWNQQFLMELSRRADDLAIMAYDTAQPVSKTYVSMVSSWTRRTLEQFDKPVRIGVPAYEDQGVAYHHPEVENVANSLAGIAAGLGPQAPDNYAGLALYAEWTLDEAETEALRRRGGTPSP